MDLFYWLPYCLGPNHAWVTGKDHPTAILDIIQMLSEVLSQFILPSEVWQSIEYSKSVGMLSVKGQVTEEFIQDGAIYMK